MRIDSRDNFQRFLNEADAEQRTLMPRWRDALNRIFLGDEGKHLTLDQKAEILGVPSPGRRQMFKLGGGAVLGAFVLAACGDDDDTSTPQTGEGGSSTTAGGEGGNMDLTLAKTAASVEALAVAVYTNPAVGDIVTNQTVLDAAGLFAEHHQAHQDALNGVVTGAGEEAVTEPNQVLFDALVQPVLDDPSEAKVLQLALDLEGAAMMTYTFAGGELSTPELRSTIMTIGGIEARHWAALSFVQSSGDPTSIFPESRAFMPSELSVPEDALIS